MVKDQKVNNDINEEVKSENVTYVTLGDGDFSYSLDLARYFASTSSSMSQKEKRKKIMKSALEVIKNNNDHINTKLIESQMQKHQKERIEIIASGIDSLEDLLTKYHDANFILKSMKNLEDGQKLSISIYHEINAIIFPRSLSLKGTPLSPSYQLVEKLNSKHTHIMNSSKLLDNKNFRHIIFNHPHIGTEDAKLHEYFLSHLFYSVHHYWLPSCPHTSNSGHTITGVFHLTLAKGQYERWNCEKCAHDQGFVLIQQSLFQPPLSSTKDKKQQQQYYQKRRHQNGKSFHSRVNDSITYTFARKSEYEIMKKEERDSCCAYILPWYDIEKKVGEETKEQIIDKSASLLPFPCPYCEGKSFLEKRSLRNHIFSLHKDVVLSSLFDDDKKAKKQKKSKVKSKSQDVYDVQSSHKKESNPKQQQLSLTCDLCKQPNNRRVFKTQKSLEDHKLAKHYGPHTSIKPDWFSNSPHICQPARTTTTTTTSEEEINVESSPMHKKMKTDGSTVATSLSSSSKENQDDTNMLSSLCCCDICGAKYTNSREEHENLFIPPTSSSSNKNNDTVKDKERAEAEFKCLKCSKSFRDKRALHQHTNFCMKAAVTHLLNSDNITVDVQQ